GVRTQKRDFLEPFEEYHIRIVSNCPMEEDKRLALIVDALSLVEHGGVEWDHIGGGEKKNELIQYAKEKLDGKVGIRYKFLGKLSHEETYAFYKDTYVDALLSVSIAESVPTVMLEAMANRIFVVATEVDGVKDVVDNQSGMLLPSDITAVQLKNVLEGLCKISKEQIAEKSEQAYQCWRNHFDADQNGPLFASEISVAREESAMDASDNNANDLIR
ncbi:MAG: glycosyltransferase, partial [Oscillospiraceae bacterium]